MANKKDNKDVVRSTRGLADAKGYGSIDWVYKYKIGPWWTKIFSKYEPKENYKRSIWHRYAEPNDTTIITPAGTAHSIYLGEELGQRRTPNFNYINGLFTTTFDNAGYKWGWGSKPKPRQKNGGTLIYDKPTLIPKQK